MQWELKVREVLTSFSYFAGCLPNNNKTTFSILDNFHEERGYTYQLSNSNQKDN
jgi:hypothetical protein